MKLTLSILRYLVYAPAHCLLAAISYPIVPFLILFQRDAWLPNWCWWFQTWDNSLDGDNGWQTEHRPWLDIPYKQLSSLQRYVCRVMWLWRNPVYGFERKVLSANPTGEVIQYGSYTEGNGNVLYVQSNSFFWNGDKSIGYGKKLNWLIGWKIMYPERPAPICSTVRFIKP
jgi:hypothetical protein